jgi:transcriptional regulator GlxA family with amidase domain
LREQQGQRPDRAVMLAQTLDPVRCNKGMRVLPDHTFDDHPPLDVLLVPGGMGTRVQVDNQILTTWLGRVAKDVSWMTSVCTGSFVLARAGLAQGRSIATHWIMEDALAEEPGVTVVRDQRWVVDGNLVTSQGVSAGIDMALWLIGQIYSPEHARATQHYIQYDPAPPYQDVPKPK